MRKSGSFDVGREVYAGQIGVSNAIVLKCWGETFRLDEFTILEVWGGTMIEFGVEMKPPGRKCDSTIEDLPWCKCIPLAILDIERNLISSRRRSIWDLVGRTRRNHLTISC